MRYILGIFGLIFFALLIAKMIIHYQLNIRNGYRVRMSPLSMLEYYLPYEKPVADEDVGLKARCNKIYKVAMACLLVTIVGLIFSSI